MEGHSVLVEDWVLGFKISVQLSDCLQQAEDLLYMWQDYDFLIMHGVMSCDTT